MATFGGDEHAERVVVPALVARTPTAVGADVETAPVIERGDHRRSFGVRTSGQISGRRGSGQRNKPGKTQQKLLHYRLQLLSASVGPEAFQKTGASAATIP